jgi:hypothetical protein
MRFRYSIRDVLWLTLMVALAAGWFIDHKRLTQPAAGVPLTDAALTSGVEIGHTHKQIVTGYNPQGLPTYTGPRGGVYHYSKEGGKVYEKNKARITPVDPDST